MALDRGQEETDLLIARIEEDVKKHYELAQAEINVKVNDYWKRFKTKDKIKQAQVKAGEITENEYNQWRVNQMILGKRWEDMRDVISNDLTNAQQIAESIAKGYIPEAYAIGANFGAYQIESGCSLDTSWILYDRPTVERIIKDNPDLLPELNPLSETAKTIREGKINAWHKDQIQSTALQGILQGESIPDIALRISNITKQDEKATIRYARTMTTGAENAGRVDSYIRAKNMGIEMEQQWMATLDDRTRESHRHLDGEHRPVGKKFSNGCRFPGDPEGSADQIWNCRCTLIPMLTGIPELDDINDLSNTELRYNANLNGMTYEEWKKGHATSQKITKQKEISESMRNMTAREYKITAKRLKVNLDE